MAEEARKSFVEQGDGTGNAPTVDYEAKARESGWAPQEQFKGDPNKWIDAEQWVKRGESFIPFLQAANRDLKEKVGSLSQRLEETARTQAATLKAIQELQTGFKEQTVGATEERKTELTAQIVAAVSEGETAKELELRDQLAEVNEELRKAKAKPAVQTVDATRGGTQAATGGDLIEDPRFKAFLADNPWFESDPIMGGAAVGYMSQLNGTAEGRAMTPEQRFVEVARVVKKRFGVADNARRQTPSKVEGSRMENSPGSGGGGGSDKSFDSMPPDARAQCDQLSKRFVGKVDGKGNVKYKDLAAYRAQYAADYYAEDWGAKHFNA